MQNFKKIKNFENFKRYGERILSETLRELLSADIDIIPKIRNNIFEAQILTN